MRLDIHSLSLALVVVYAVSCLLTLVLYLGRQTYRGAALWILGQFLLGLSFSGILFRHFLPPLIGISLTNALFLLATLLTAHSLWAFRFEKPFPFFAYLLPVLAFGGFFLLQDASFNAKAALFSALSGLECAGIVVLLSWRIEKPYRLPNLLMALPYFLIALGNLIRFFWNLFEPVVPSFDEQSGFNALYYLLAIGVSLVTLFGYYMMNSIRVERSLIAKDDEIEGRNRELAELVRTRSLFLSVIAHDLRGPIGGSARYLRKHLLKPGVRLEDKTAALETLATSLDLTHALLEKLLWWSRGQEEEWKPAKEKVELAPVLEGVRALMEEVIGAKDLRVEFSIHAGAESLVGDRECVELILRNLLSNAVKFSHGGGRIGIEARPEGRGVRITVEDEGIGIDEGMMAGLFRMETKHSRKGTEGEPGSGLGLILCRSLAEKSGGSMEVTSVFGKGTRVSLSLPGPPL